METHRIRALDSEIADGSVTMTATLDDRPSDEWAHTFEDAREVAGFGSQIHLSGDHVDVVADEHEARGAALATRLAIYTTNQLMLDHDLHQ